MSGKSSRRRRAEERAAFDMGIGELPGATLPPCELATTLDRLYFERHPGATEYTRHYIRHELEGNEAVDAEAAAVLELAYRAGALRYMRVQQVRPGFRKRKPILPSGFIALPDVEFVPSDLDGQDGQNGQDGEQT